MEMEYKDPSRRGRWIVVIGIVLAVAAGGAAFFLINQAQQQAGQAGLQRVAVVVAVQTIPARKIIEAADVTVREIPLDDTNAQGIASTPDKVIGRVPAVAILQGQMVLTNLLASSTEGGQFSVLGPADVFASDSPDWRAISMTVPDDRAVGGLLTPNQTVDVFVTASVNVLTNSEDGLGDQAVVPEHAASGQVRDVLRAQGAARRRGGDLPSPGQRCRCVQPRAPTRRRHPAGRCQRTRNHHEPRHHPLRAADPGGVPAGLRTRPDAATDPGRDPGPVRLAGSIAVALRKPVVGRPGKAIDSISRR